MQITEYIVNRFRNSDNHPFLIGICGRAGAGKTTLLQKISDELTSACIQNVAYSGDWRFILDSTDRKEWLEEKWRSGMDAYLNAINQFGWWDFTEIFKDLAALQNEQAITITGAYNRLSGTKTAEISLGPIRHGIILYENCILGHLDTMKSFDTIVIVNTPDQLCLERVLRKDAHRRPVSDIATRYLMTTYSENIFLRALRTRFSARTVACDSDGQFSPFPEINEITHIPVPINVRKPNKLKKGTIFCDLDGTLVKHIAVPSESGDDIELLEGSIEKVREFRLKGYHVVLTTSRSQANIISVLAKLQTMGLEYDQILCDLPIGPRHLINDSKDQEVRAIAHPLTRNSGLKNVKIQ